MAPCTTPLCQFQMIGSPLPTIAKFHQIQDKDKRQKDSKEGPPGNPPCRVHALCRASCPHTIIADFTSTALFCSVRRQNLRLTAWAVVISAGSPTARSSLLVPQPPFLISSVVSLPGLLSLLLILTQESPFPLSCFPQFGYFLLICFLDILRGPLWRLRQLRKRSLKQP